MGTPAQEVALILDTGSDWITIESSFCSNCYGKNFNQELSSTFSYAADDYSLREYGSATLDGIEAKDKVCLFKEHYNGDRMCVP